MISKERFQYLEVLELWDFDHQRFQLANSLCIELLELCLDIIGSEFKIEEDLKEKFINTVDMANEINNRGYNELISKNGIKH